MRTSVANPVGDVAVLGQRREGFAALVAAGVSYREAAERAGFSRDYGWDLMQQPAVRQRVNDLAEQPAEMIRAGIEVEIIELRNRAACGDLTDADREDIRLRLQLVLAHAKLRGMWIEKRASVSTNLNVALDDLSDQLEALEPGARQEIRARIRAVEERRSRRQARRELEERSDAQRKVPDGPLG
jgi:hypothetical protein